MLIFFTPDWMLNVKPNCNGILQNVRKANRLQKKFFFEGLGGRSEPRTAPPHPVGRDN